MATLAGQRESEPPSAEASICHEDEDFSEIFRTWFHEVCRWLVAMGCPQADLEDLAQEVFFVVRRKLPRFDGDNLPGWLYQIARRVASGHRRSAWFRHLFSRRRDVVVEDFGQTELGPEELVQQKEAQQLVRRALDRMSPKRRAVFYLFEVEGLSGKEIARLENVPEATVRTRLFHARRDFRALVRRCSREDER